ncbi:hypothetical protein ZWY2020_050014 [Hordeum vulgare]|nr:hypothetical protein ZWY2020_050014 [Hordeum vulgare]
MGRERGGGRRRPLEGDKGGLKNGGGGRGAQGGVVGRARLALAPRQRQERTKRGRERGREITRGSPGLVAGWEERKGGTGGARGGGGAEATATRCRWRATATGVGWGRPVGLPVGAARAVPGAGASATRSAGACARQATAPHDGRVRRGGARNGRRRRGRCHESVWAAVG